MRVSDEELMLRCRHGDTSAFELLVARYKDAILNFAYRMIHDYHRAEDVTQETFLRVFRNADHYKPSAKFKNWLYLIAANLCKNELRRCQRHQQTSLDAMMAENTDAWPRSLTVSTNLPDHLYEKKEQQRLIEQALTRLPENQRLALIMVTYQGLRYDEIADVLNCSVSAVKSLIHRARQGLRGWLVQSGIRGSTNASL